MIRHTLAILVLTLVLPLSPTHGQTERPGAWRGDLDFLVRELEYRHPDLYHAVSPARFRASVDSLHARIPRLDDHEIAVELARLLALVGDGHTAVPLASDSLGFRRYPVLLHLAADGLLVLAASPEHTRLAGARVVRIGRVTAGEAMAAVEPLLSKDNRWSRRATRTYETIPEVLAALDLVDDPDSLPLVVEDAAGRSTAVLRPVPREPEPEWRYGAPADSLPWLRYREEPYAFTFLDPSTVYLTYNNAWEDRDDVPWDAFIDRFVERAEAERVDRLVIDLRWNSGGDIDRARRLLHAVLRLDRVNRPGGLFVLVGPDTFSAGTNLAVDLDLHTEPVFVGRPTGGRPNVYSQRGRFRLPRTGLEIRNSALYIQHGRPTDLRPAVLPDIVAPLTTEAYRAGRDPALEAALAWSPDRPPISIAIRDTLRLRGPHAAAEAYRRLRRTRPNDFDYGEAPLNRLGYELLEEDRVDDAVAIFRLNVEAHPWSANLRDSLGDGLRAAGRVDEAVVAFCRAFAMNPDFRHSREKVLELAGQEACGGVTARSPVWRRSTPAP